MRVPIQCNLLQMLLAPIVVVVGVVVVACQLSGKISPASNFGP
jgi:hypothetical protein